jgi:nucleotide-binding universal stress UspA family protein
MPFLQSAGEAEIVTVEGTRQKPASSGYEATDIAAHLDRHGVKVTVHAVGKGKKSVAEALLAGARQGSADLIVMGAYGHSRWREWIMGGTTREMLAMSEVPILMAH